MADRGLGFAERRPPPPPGYETPEQFAARKRREADQRDRAEWERRQRLQRQRDQDPYGDVTMDSQGRPQWRYGAPHVGPKVVDDTMRTLGNVPGPHRPLTDRYEDIRQMTMGGGGTPEPPSPGGARRPSMTPDQRRHAADGRQRVRDKLENSPEELERRRREIQQNWQRDREAMARGRAPATTKQARIRDAIASRNGLVSRLQKLRTEYNNATPQRRERIMEEIEMLGKQIDDVDRFLRGPQ